MIRRPHVGARRSRVEYARRPGDAGCQPTQARHTAQEPLRCWPRHPLSATCGLVRRMVSGIRRSYSCHSQDVRDSGRGSSNHVLKRTAARSGVQVSIGCAAA
jgi:hypothetical protein